MKATAIHAPGVPTFNDLCASEIYRLRRIIASVVTHARVPEASIFGDRRTARIAHARQLAMVLIRESTDLSLVEVGEIFDRDHGTVIHAMKCVEKRKQTEAGFALTYSSLLSQAKA